MLCYESDLEELDQRLSGAVGDGDGTVFVVRLQCHQPVRFHGGVANDKPVLVDPRAWAQRETETIGMYKKREQEILQHNICVH